MLSLEDMYEGKSRRIKGKLAPIWNVVGSHAKERAKWSWRTWLKTLKQQKTTKKTSFKFSEMDDHYSASLSHSQGVRWFFFTELDWKSSVDLWTEFQGRWKSLSNCGWHDWHSAFKPDLCTLASVLGVTCFRMIFCFHVMERNWSLGVSRVSTEKSYRFIQVLMDGSKEIKLVENVNLDMKQGIWDCGTGQAGNAKWHRCLVLGKVRVCFGKILLGLGDDRTVYTCSERFTQCADTFQVERET